MLNKQNTSTFGSFSKKVRLRPKNIAQLQFRDMKNKNNSFLLQDLVIIAVSILVAIILVRTDVLITLLTSTRELEFLGSFVAGIFFTSIFTVPVATVTLGEIAQAHGLVETAALGALGSVVGDLIIFRFVRDRFSEHLTTLIKQTGAKKRLKSLFRLRLFRWLTFLMGGIIIASPLPDEIGISLLGFSKMKVSLFIPLSFTLNFIGILLIGMVARSLD